MIWEPGVCPASVFFQDVPNSRSVLAEGALLPRNIFNPEDLLAPEFIFLFKDESKIFQRTFFLKYDHLNRINDDTNFTNYIQRSGQEHIWEI